MKGYRLLNTLFFMFVAGLSSAKATEITIDTFPQGKQPLEIGRRVSERFLSRPFFNYGKAGEPRLIFYPEACAWYGALRFAALSDNSSLIQRLAERYRPLLAERDTLIPPADHVDHSVIGAIPLELYIQTKDTGYLITGKKMADQQWSVPEGKHLTAQAKYFSEKNYSWQTRLWIDDMFMINLLQSEAYLATGNPNYINRAARQMVLYLDSLQQPNGLFYHANDAPFCWGRGNGWMAAGMAILLGSLPGKNPDKARILRGYRKMMSALLHYQAKNGMWRQLVDDESSWEETSGTGMFAYAMIMGIKRRWLNTNKYRPAAHKAWLALTDRIDEHADLREICEGTNKKNDHQYYLDRKRLTGDLHGQAPLLWCAAAWLEP